MLVRMNLQFTVWWIKPDQTTISSFNLTLQFAHFDKRQ